MPIKHAALKQLRKDRGRQQRNQAVRTELKNLTKRLLTLLSTQKLDEAATLLHVVAKEYDHAASKGIMHPNTAARYKSRLALQLNKRRST
ncbi:MAG: 30S ribosomal protein S20 [Candidatus Omnitrophica bacterium]|nr:30S ribosomal protein S20 [Candidatus Omnitrophota bacterium]